MKDGLRTADGFDNQRVALPPEVAEFLRAARPTAAVSAAARSAMARLTDRCVLAWPGLLVLTGLPVAVDAAQAALRRISSLIGDVLPQNRDGALIKHVSDRGTHIGEGVRSRYSESRFGGDLHTDGAESVPPVPDVFTLLCVRQSAEGGALVVVHLRDLERELGRVSGVLDTLRTPFHFDRRGDQGAGERPTIPKPVLFTQHGRPAITYLRTYIEVGHARGGEVPSLTTRQRAALDALDDAISRKDVMRRGKLREGELAIVDNLSSLHGRTEFRDDPARPRLLLRTWIRVPPRQE